MGARVGPEVMATFFPFNRFCMTSRLFRELDVRFSESVARPGGNRSLLSERERNHCREPHGQRQQGSDMGEIGRFRRMEGAGSPGTETGQWGTSREILIENEVGTEREVLFGWSEPLPLDEDDNPNGSEDDGGHHGDEEGVMRVLERQRNVHAIDAGHERRKHEDDGDAGEELHDDADVVGDDRGKGVHHAAEDVAVDVGHLDGLLVVDDDVLQEVLVVLGHLEHAGSLEAFHDQFVGADGGCEVNETLLKVQQADEDLVVQRPLQFGLDACRPFVDRLQVAEVKESGPLEDVKNKSRSVGSGEIADLSADESFEDSIFLGGDGDDAVGGYDDAQGESGKRDFGLGVEARGSHDDEHVGGVNVEARRFVGIERIGQEIEGDIPLAAVSGSFLGRGLDKVNPAVRLRLGNGTEGSFGSLQYFNHGTGSQPPRPGDGSSDRSG